MFLKELFDRKFVDAVLNEWHKTMMDLPAGLRQAYEMGLVSSTQMDACKSCFFLQVSFRGSFYYWLFCLVGVEESKG